MIAESDDHERQESLSLRGKTQQGTEYHYVGSPLEGNEEGDEREVGSPSERNGEGEEKDESDSVMNENLDGTGTCKSR